MTSRRAGGDGAQPYDSKEHSTLLWGLKLQDRDPTVAAKDDTWAPLGMCEGPTEPKNMDSILERILQFFKDHDPGALHPVMNAICALCIQP